MAFDSVESDGISNSFIASVAILSVLFIIGLYLQIRIIIVSKNEKGITWKLDIYHSVMMSVYFSFRILFEIFTDLFPSMHVYVGKWFCYVAFFVQIFTGLTMVSHSLVIVIYKYIYINHPNLFSSLGTNNASLFAMVTNGIIQISLSVSAVVRPNQPKFSSVSLCLGRQAQTSSVSNITAVEMLRKFFLCGLDDHDDNHVGIFSLVLDITNITGCFMTSIIFIVILTNVMEILLYHRIFSRMKR